jgi:hypothetical protein
MKSIKTNPNSAKGPDKEKMEKMLGDICFQLRDYNNELHVFFSKKNIINNSSVVNNMQYNLFTIFSMKLDPGGIS